MIIAIDIVLSVVLIFLGYAFTCHYFNKSENNGFDTSVLKFTRNKVLYLLAAAVSMGLLITMFQTVYFSEDIHQIKLLVLVSVIFPAAAIDLRVQKIPNKILICALILRILIYAAEFIASVPVAVSTLKSDLIGAVIIGGFFFLLLLVFKNSIGMGDIKLFAIMGLYQGLWGVINSVFFSLMVSFVLSVTLLITKKKHRKDTVAFGPSILLGTIIGISLSGM